MADHDQRFKILLKEFFREFLTLFFSRWAARFDLAAVEWWDKELHLDPPQGEKRVLDLVAKVPLTDAAPGETPHQVILVHTEVEAEDSVTDLEERFPEYRRTLSRTFGLPVLPLAVFLTVGFQGLGERVVSADVLGEWVNRFRYWYVGLPALDGPTYLEGDNWLGVALAALMKPGPDGLAKFSVKVQERLVKCPESPARKYLLLECVQAYAPLTPADKIELADLLEDPRYAEVKAMNKTVFEEGLEKGIQGQRRMIQRQVKRKFGPLSDAVLQRLADYPVEKLEDLAEAVVVAQSLKELRLED